MTDKIKYNKILNYISLIKREPKKASFFLFDAEKKIFVVEGCMIKLLPSKYDILYKKNEFYIQFSYGEKAALYYAFDNVVFDDGDIAHANQEEGYIPWDDIEDNVYNFLALNIKELTNVAMPHMEADSIGKSQTTYSPPTNVRNPPAFGSTNYGLFSNNWKERDAFTDKLFEHLKNNRTTLAVDHIDSFYHKMITDQKFDDMDILFRSISFEKLNVPTMIRILTATDKANAFCKDRVLFFNKVKDHIKKLRPIKINLLKSLEPFERQEL